MTISYPPICPQAPPSQEVEKRGCSKIALDCLSYLSRLIRAIALICISPVTFFCAREWLSRQWAVVTKSNSPAAEISPQEQVRPLSAPAIEIPITQTLPALQEQVSLPKFDADLLKMLFSYSLREPVSLYNYNGVQFRLSYERLSDGHSLRFQNSEDPSQELLLILNNDGNVGEDVGDSLYNSTHEWSRRLAAFSSELLLARGLYVRNQTIHVHPELIKKYPAKALEIVVRQITPSTTHISICFLEYDFTPINSNGRGLQTQFISDVARSLLKEENRTIDVTEASALHLEMNSSVAKRLIYTNFAKLISYSYRSRLAIGRLLSDGFFDLLKVIATAPERDNETLSWEAARLVSNSGQRSIFNWISGICELSDVEQMRAVGESFSDRSAARVQVIEWFKPVVNAARAVYEGLSQELKADLIRGSGETISQNIQGRRLEAADIISRFQPNSQVEEKVQYLREIITEKLEAGDTDWVERFLFCVTSQRALRADTYIEFTPCRSRVCIAHSCFRQLEVPSEHQSKEEFLQTLELTMREISFSRL